MTMRGICSVVAIFANSFLFNVLIFPPLIFLKTYICLYLSLDVENGTINLSLC